MTDGDDTSEPGALEPKKPDLRFTRREDQGVSIERDMSGSGHLARGSRTNMSRIKMSVQAKPRDYLDPELAALHVTPPKPKHTQAAEAAEAEQRNKDVQRSVSSPLDAALPEKEPQSVVGRIANAMRRFLSGS